MAKTKTKNFTLRLTSTEHKQLQDGAIAEGKTIAKYIRNCMFHYEDKREITRLLLNLTNNVNQIARKLNQSTFHLATFDGEELTKQILQVIQNVNDDCKN